MICKKCGKNFEGENLLCDECATILPENSCNEDGCNDVNVEKESFDDSNMRCINTDDDVLIIENEGVAGENNVILKKEKIRAFFVSSSRGVRWIAVIVLIIVVVIFFVFVKSPVSRVLSYIENGEYENAANVYSELDETEKNDADDKIKKICKNWISDYNSNKLKYSEVEERIGILVETYDDMGDIVDELEFLYNSKAAFESGIRYKEDGNWTSAIEEFKKVKIADSNYEKAIVATRECQNQDSLEHYKKGIELESNELWEEAIQEFELVEKITADEFIKAEEHKANCIEKITSGIYIKLDALFNNGEYEEGLEVIEIAEKYMENDEALENYKYDFKLKKEEADRIKEENKYNTGITYNQLARDPDKYKGEYVKFRGKILQVQSDDGITVYRLGTSGYGYYDNVILVVQYSENTSNRILEDDMVTLKGVSSGLHTYEAVMGNSITIPMVIAEEIIR